MAGTVALTGGTGFVGCHAARRLMDAGWTVRVLVRRPPIHPLWAGRRFEAVAGTLDDDGALAELAADADALVHVGGVVRARDRAAFFAANAAGAASAARAARAAGVGRLILVSTMAAREPRLSAYAASKRAGEAAFEAAGGLVLRPTAVYGPWDRATLAIFRAARLGFAPMARNADARLSFIHVADVAAAIESALRTGETGVREIDDGRVEGYRWADVLAAAGRAVGRTARPVRLPDQAFLLAGHAASLLARAGGRVPFFSAGKAREMLHPDWRRAAPAPTGWQPTIAIAEGFATTAAWYREHGWLRA